MRPDHPHLLRAASSAGRLRSGVPGPASAFHSAVPVLPDDRRARKLRRCLQCRHEYLSDGAGDRICLDCEAANRRLLEGL
ncbi:MAG: hypothetical protein Kow00114_27180 [Kiloniellaceae bacterium]